MKTKGVFCLEGLWNNKLNDKTSVKPMLDLLEVAIDIPYIYYDCATTEETKYLLNKYKAKGYSKYSILYLAFHGMESNINTSNGDISIDEIGEILEGKCKGRIIHFGSCKTLNIDARKLKGFLRQTGASAVCGYKAKIPWLESSAFDLLLMNQFQDNSFDGRGIKTIQRKANELSKKFKDLQFRMVVK